MSTNWVTNILEHGVDRAFPNLYQIEIQRKSEEYFPNSKYLAEKIDFGQFQITTDFNEAFQAHTFKGVEKIKSATISFRETSKFSVIQAIKGWMNDIYDFDTNSFKSFTEPAKPYGTIKAVFDDPSNGFSIVMEEAIPTSIDYPSLSWGDSEPVKINCTFSFNSIQFILGTREEATQGGLPRQVNIYV